MKLGIVRQQRQFTLGLNEGEAKSLLDAFRTPSSNKATAKIWGALNRAIHNDEETSE